MDQVELRLMLVCSGVAQVSREKCQNYGPIIIRHTASGGIVAAAVDTEFIDHSTLVNFGKELRLDIKNNKNCWRKTIAFTMCSRSSVG